MHVWCRCFTTYTREQEVLGTPGGGGPLVNPLRPAFTTKKTGRNNHYPRYQVPEIMRKAPPPTCLPSAEQSQSNVQPGKKTTSISKTHNRYSSVCWLSHHLTENEHSPSPALHQTISGRRKKKKKSTNITFSPLHSSLLSLCSPQNNRITCKTTFSVSSRQDHLNCLHPFTILTCAYILGHRQQSLGPNLCCPPGANANARRRKCPHMKHTMMAFGWPLTLRVVLLRVDTALRPARAPLFKETRTRTVTRTFSTCRPLPTNLSLGACRVSHALASISTLTSTSATPPARNPSSMLARTPSPS